MQAVFAGELSTPPNPRTSPISLCLAAGYAYWVQKSIRNILDGLRTENPSLCPTITHSVTRAHVNSIQLAVKSIYMYSVFCHWFPYPRYFWKLAAVPLRVRYGALRVLSMSKPIRGSGAGRRHGSQGTDVVRKCSFLTHQVSRHTKYMCTSNTCVSVFERSNLA